MTRILSILAAATMTVGAAVSVAQADAMTMMQGYTACNESYGQCLKDGTDTAIAATPAEGVAKMQSNMQNTMACGEALRACYAAVK
jgi:hypothetical protein